jgi:hypothetical protein
VPRKRGQWSEEDLCNWKLLEHFRKLLIPKLKKEPALDEDPRRKLVAEEYFSLCLFRMLNPLITSMRGLCATTHYRKMRQVCSERVSPTCFSEAQHLFNPDILAEIVCDLAAEAKGVAQFGDPQVREAIKSLTIVDGTVLRAVNRMTWAPAAGHGSSIKLHLHFSVFDQVPEDWSITAGKTSELKEWKKKVRPGSFTVADRLYSEDHLHLKRLKRDGADFVIRLLGNVTRTQKSDSRPLTSEDHKAGVVSDRIEELGILGGGPVLRVVEIHSQGKIFLLATTREDLPAHVIGLIYRYRWQIELFFKWFKTMLPCQHWLAESPAGVAIQIYCAMIAALLLQLWTGQRPNKRQMEALRLYWIGFIDEHELVQALSQKIQ